MKNLLYLSYGRGLHVQENIFSILSAKRFLSPGQTDYRFLIYTDAPELFAGIDATLERIDEATLRNWSGPCGYRHRRKTMALIDALQKYPAPTALLDGDTYFLKSPEKLFARIGPGRTVLHLREGKLLDAPGEGYKELGLMLGERQFHDLGGRTLEIVANSMMWNSGVIGIDPADRNLLPEVVHLMDNISRELPKVHTVEQFAMGIILENCTYVHEARDVVFHYWPDYLRQPFRSRLPGILDQFALFPEGQRSRMCYEHRPRPGWLRRIKLMLKRILRYGGFLKNRGVESNG